MAVWSALSCVLVALAGMRIAWNAGALRVLADLALPDPPIWPTLTVLVPACNEADTLESAMVSLLAQDYPGLAVVLVDDRSTDGTGAVVDRIAAGDARVTPIHIDRLPDGWLGKVHALSRAREKATGEWLLSTDADVHFAPGVLKQAVRFALAEGAGHVAILPDVPVPGFFLQTAIGAFSQSFFLIFNGRTIGTPGTGRMMGVGAFNLMRAKDLDASPGFDHVRMEVIDDVGVAQMLNRNGVKGAFAGGTGMLSVAWYPTLGAMIRGLEKGAFAALGFSVVRVTVVVVGSGVVIAGVLAAPVVLSAPWGFTLAGVSVLAYVAGGVIGFRKLGAAWWLTLTAPLGSVINLLICVRSAWKTLRRGGVDWRGTFYPLAALRAGQRISF